MGDRSANAPILVVVPKAIVLLSGGLDSATCLAIARERGFECHCLGFLYGQRHAYEAGCAMRVGLALGASQYRAVQIDAELFVGSALTGDIDVPKNGATEGIPVTYVPARNTLFLSFGLAWAESLGAEAVFIGVNALDYSGYPDCRPEYIGAFQRMADLATRAGVEGHGPRIEAPLIGMTKAEIIREGLRLGVDYSMTFSCYDPQAGDGPCGLCDSCRLRAKGFAEACIADPALP
jgi:7-cyano-7-deazaguanine synthase